MSLFKTEKGARKVKHGFHGHDRRGLLECEGGWALILWWGPVEAPTDAKIIGLGGQVLADGVEEVCRMAGL